MIHVCNPGLIKIFRFKKNILNLGFALSANLIAVGQVTDRDGKVYNTVTIGSQVWMAENLNVSTFRNGDPILEAKSNTDWHQAGEEKKPAWCYYDNDPVNGRRYGKLYNWYAVNDRRGLAPQGWHIPGTLEWADLSDYLGGEKTAGMKMKTTSGWKPYTNWGTPGNGTNESGFSAIPTGSRIGTGEFMYLGQSVWWWSSSELDEYNAWGRLINGWIEIRRINSYKETGFSIRCLED